jgi:hypothetical protein
MFGNTIIETMYQGGHQLFEIFFEGISRVFPIFRGSLWTRSAKRAKTSRHSQNFEP